MLISSLESNTVGFLLLEKERDAKSEFKSVCDDILKVCAGWGHFKSSFTVTCTFITVPILSLFAFLSTDRYFIACSFTMKAMEDQVVQEESGYQDDEVNLWFFEKQVQQMSEGIVTVYWSPQRDRKSPKTTKRKFNLFKILLQSYSKKISLSVSVQLCSSDALH